MKRLSINDIYICEIPEKWAEFTESDIKALCNFINYAASPHALKIMMVLHISGLQLVRGKSVPQAKGRLYDKTLFPVKGKKTGMFYAASIDIAFMAENLSFLFPDSEHKYALSSGIVKNYFPVLKTKRFEKLHGPAGGLYNISFSEFVRLETLYERLEKNKTDLARFCAVMYRPRDKSVNPDHFDYKGDIRLPYNDHLLDKYASKTKHLKKWQFNYIKLFFEGCRSFIIEKFPNSFASIEPRDPGKTTFEHFNTLIVKLANNDLTKASYIRSAPIYDVMTQLESFATEAMRNNEMQTKPHKY